MWELDKALGSKSRFLVVFLLEEKSRFSLTNVAERRYTAFNGRNFGVGIKTEQAWNQDVNQSPTLEMLPLLRGV